VAAFSLFAPDYFKADLNPSWRPCKRKTTPRAPPTIDKLIDEANCSERLQPKSAFSRFPPVHRVDLKGQLPVETGPLDWVFP
jgi:hypothetical protein